MHCLTNFAKEQKVVFFVFIFFTLFIFLPCHLRGSVVLVCTGWTRFDSLDVLDENSILNKIKKIFYFITVQIRIGHKVFFKFYGRNKNLVSVIVAY